MIADKVVWLWDAACRFRQSYVYQNGSGKF